jgi:hypothetical protein
MASEAIVQADFTRQQIRLALLRILTNLGRIARLWTYAFDASHGMPEPLRAELFRSCVVLLHATFEDWIRTVARARLMDVGPGAFERMTLPDQTDTKYSLSHLSQFRGKAVDDVLTSAVDNFLSTYSVNNRKQLRHLVVRLGLQTADFDECFDDIEWLMRRRHRIAHEADIPKHGTAPPPGLPLDDERAQFFNAVDAVSAFADRLTRKIVPEWLTESVDAEMRACLRDYNEATNTPLWTVPGGRLRRQSTDDLGRS